MKRKIRKKLRLDGYDYSQYGYYFVTICTKNNICWFGKVENEIMCLSKIGSIVYERMFWLEKHYSYIRIDKSIVMPNHIHLILQIKNVVSGRDLSLQKNKKKVKSLSGLIGALKTTSSKKIHTIGCDNFSWQRSVHDRVIRNEKELEKVQHYIIYNPMKHTLKKENIFY